MNGNDDFEEFIQAMFAVRDVTEEIKECFLEVALACGDVLEFIVEIEKERENEAMRSYKVMHEF